MALLASAALLAIYFITHQPFTPMSVSDDMVDTCANIRGFYADAPKLFDTPDSVGWRVGEYDVRLYAVHPGGFSWRSMLFLDVKKDGWVGGGIRLTLTELGFMSVRLDSTAALPGGCIPSSTIYSDDTGEYKIGRPVGDGTLDLYNGILRQAVLAEVIPPAIIPRLTFKQSKGDWANGRIAVEVEGDSVFVAQTITRLKGLGWQNHHRQRHFWVYGGIGGVRIADMGPGSDPNCDFVIRSAKRRALVDSVLAFLDRRIR